MKAIILLFLKYKLYFPYTFCRFIFYNFIKIRRENMRSLSRYANFDVPKSAQICLTQPVLFGWCNMRKSRLETSLYMGVNSHVHFNGKGRGIMSIGYGSYIHVGACAYLQIGNSFINREVKIICNKRITIGNGCVIAMGTVIRDNDGGKS